MSSPLDEIWLRVNWHGSIVDWPQGGATHVDIACDPELVKLATSLTSLPVSIIYQIKTLKGPGAHYIFDVLSLLCSTELWTFLGTGVRFISCSWGLCCCSRSRSTHGIVLPQTHMMEGRCWWYPKRSGNSLIASCSFWPVRRIWLKCSDFVSSQIELGNYDSFYESGRVFAASEVKFSLNY